MGNNIGVISIKDGKKTYQIVLDDVGKSEGGRRIIRFGRNPDNDIVLQAGCASRNHGCFYIENGSYYIQDYDSTNGLVCNQKGLQKKKLETGDVVTIPNRGNIEGEGISFTFSEKLRSKVAEKPKSKPQNRQQSVPKKKTKVGLVPQNMPPQDVPERIVEEEVVVEKVKKYIPWWAIVVMSVMAVTAICLIICAVLSSPKHKLKGSYEYHETDDYAGDCTVKITFDKGTYKITESIENWDIEDCIDIGTYKIKKGIIEMTSLRQTGDDEVKLGNKEKFTKDSLTTTYECLFDSKYQQILLEGCFFEQEDKKEKLDFSMDEDDIVSWNQKLKTAVMESFEELGMSTIEMMYPDGRIYISGDDLKNPQDVLIEKISKKMDYAQDDTLQYLMTHEVGICIGYDYSGYSYYVDYYFYCL